MIDAVLSYHLNPYSCGVAKFNHALAKRLGVPCLQLNSDEATLAKHPLLSVKWAEMPLPNPYVLSPWLHHDVLSHDQPENERQRQWVTNARHSFVAAELGCPSTIDGNPTRGTLDVLCFGMAHKFQAGHFERLKTLLERTDPRYTVSLSTAVHEGNPWDKALQENVELMRGIFGENLRHLGFLADDGLARELRQVQAVALFYDPAARANNTTLWAALDAGTPVITNLDADSPKELQHNVSVFDLAQLESWPEAAARRVTRWGGRKASAAYSWDRLIEQLKAPVHA